MSYGHGANGPLRDVVEVLSGWTCRKSRQYYRKVKLSCGHTVAQTGRKRNNRLLDGNYSCDDIRNLTTHKTAYCHICKMEKTND